MGLVSPLRAPQRQVHLSPAHPLTCPLTLVTFSAGAASSGPAARPGSIGPLVLSLQAQGQRWPPSSSAVVVGTGRGDTAGEV